MQPLQCSLGFLLSRGWKGFEMPAHHKVAFWFLLNNHRAENASCLPLDLAKVQPTMVNITQAPSPTFQPHSQVTAVRGGVAAG